MRGRIGLYATQEARDSWSGGANNPWRSAWNRATRFSCILFPKQIVPPSSDAGGGSRRAYTGRDLATFPFRRGHVELLRANRSAALQLKSRTPSELARKAFAAHLEKGYAAFVKQIVLDVVELLKHEARTAGTPADEGQRQAQARPTDCVQVG